MRGAKTALEPGKPTLVHRTLLFRPDHITETWLDEAENIAKSTKYQETVRKMEDEGLRKTVLNPPGGAQGRDAELDPPGKLAQPTLLVWGYNDPTAELKRGQLLFG
jgi:hypothetical protein